MNDPITAIKEQLDTHTVTGAPDELRDAVLRDLRRELKSESWDRRLAKTAVTLLAVGMALNSSLLLRGESNFAARRSTVSEGSLLRTAVAVARVTDIETARQLANQISAFNGHVLTSKQAAALDAAIAQELAKSRKG